MTTFSDLAERSKILVVDDNPTNVLLLEKILESQGYSQVTTTTDSREVAGLYDEHHFDLILLDIRMPHMDGFQVMDALAVGIEDDYLPILVLTAQTDTETCLKALGKGAKDFITKPFQQVEVLHRIRNMLEVRQLYNQQKHQKEILDQAVRERTEELRETQLEVIRRLGRAGEYRDNETGMHVVRMSKSCQLLALASGLSEAESEVILHASPMHDVGKIGIPDAILLKPGKLDPEEWAIMQTHAQIGANILGEHQSDLMKKACSIALSHHERWDGKGYPNGLAGEAIPVEGRIAAIADVFDALTSERPYKKAWAVEDAVEFLKGNAGSHFDPRLVDLFVGILDDILIVRRQFADPVEGGEGAPVQDGTVVRAAGLNRS
ncbi:MAG: HD domain-containing phosphohydrolase [Magnetovibrionaceae bacterium]